MKTTMLAIASVACLLLSPAHALETLPEDELSQTTGQDGLSVGVKLPTNGWIVNAVEFHDKTGISSSIKPGYDFNRGDLIARNLGLKTCTENTINGTCTASAFPSLNLAFDTTGDANNNGTANDPMFNIRLALSGGANKLRIYIDKLALRNGGGGNETTFLDFVHPDAAAAGHATGSGKDYFDLVPAGGGTLMVLQIGNENAGHMMHLTNANFGTLDFGQLILRDSQDNGVNNRNLRFNFQLDNVNLTNGGFDVGDAGLVFSIPSFGASGMDITMGNITAGNTAANMGTIGIKGLNVTNFTLTVAGKS